MRLLIVEDQSDLADTLEEVLDAFGHNARTVYSGSAALLVASDFLPDIIICDLAMPGLDGLTLCRALRSRPELARTQFIAWSGYVDPDLEEEALESGFDEVLHKPVSVECWERLLGSACRLPLGA